jgi:hypothetical protein
LLINSLTVETLHLVFILARKDQKEAKKIEIVPLSAFLEVLHEEEYNIEGKGTTGMSPEARKAYKIILLSWFHHTRTQRQRSCRLTNVDKRRCK